MKKYNFIIRKTNEMEIKLNAKNHSEAMLKLLEKAFLKDKNFFIRKDTKNNEMCIGILKITDENGNENLKDYDDFYEQNRFFLTKENESDLIENEIVLSMKNFIQHGSTTCYDHCLSVSYYSYKIAKKFNLDAKSVARAGLLHDLFLYDWHKVLEKKPLFQKHGFTHPRTALENACKYFNLNEIEKDIIEKHMWPLTPRPPRYAETYLVGLADKIAACLEMMRLYRPLGFGRRVCALAAQRAH